MLAKGRYAWVVTGLMILEASTFGQWRPPDRFPPPTRTHQARAQIEAQFRQAQVDLANPIAYNDPRSFSVPIDAFLFVSHIEKDGGRGVPCPPGVPYECCWGWFVFWTTPTQVHFTLRKGPRMEVIGVRHESMHAIAWYLGRPDWRTIGHNRTTESPIVLIQIPDPQPSEETP